MKRLIFPISIFTLLIALVSCNSDDFGNPTIHDPNTFFEPSAGATDSTSILRKEFQEKYGSYLLFNDTIQKNFKGFDLNGDSVFWSEVLAIDYTVGQVVYANNCYTYLYLNTLEDKKTGLDFIKKYIMPHLTNKLKPYSWFLCNQINYVNSSNGDLSHPYAASGQRSIAVATGLLSKFKTEAQRKTLVDRIMLVIMNNLISNNTGAFGDFFAVSGNYYGTSLSASGGETEQAIARKYGFLDKTTNTWGATVFPDEDSDLSQFCTYLISRDDAYMESTFNKYPLVLKKWYLFKNILIDLGYVITID